MSNDKYCYPNTNVLINKFNIKDSKEFFEAEKQYTALRLYQIQESPIKGRFNFNHLKKIHKYIFQDVYDWAGQTREVEIGKGNLFCTVACLYSYAEQVFAHYFPQCYNARTDLNKFTKALAKNYANLNALHPFREGNGRAQREFARCLCSYCALDFNLNSIRHEEMLKASIESFNKGNNLLFEEIFKKAVRKDFDANKKVVKILTKDDLDILFSEKKNKYEFFEKNENAKSKSLFTQINEDQDLVNVDTVNTNYYNQHM